MMEEEELFHLCVEGQRDDVVQAAVAPADVLLVFLGIELHVHDEDVGAAKEVGDLKNCARILMAHFIVGEEGDGTVRREQAVANTSAGVISEASLHRSE